MAEVGARGIDELVLLGQGRRRRSRRSRRIRRRAARRSRRAAIWRPRRAGAVRQVARRRQAAQHRALRRRPARRSALRARREREVTAEARHVAGAVRLPHLRQVHPRLPERRELHLRAAAHRDPDRQAAGRGRRRVDHERAGSLKFEKKHQLANFADFCNECGNCDVFCPRTAARTSPSRASSGRARTGGGDQARRLLHRARRRRHRGRFGGKEYRLRLDADGRARFAGEGFDLAFREAEPEATMSGTATAEVDLTYFHILNCCAGALDRRDQLRQRVRSRQAQAR